MVSRATFASGGAVTSCIVVGSLEALPGVDATAACARFEREFVPSIRESGVTGNVSIELAFHEAGSIDAVIRLTKRGSTTRYPTISVTSLDRAIRLSDLDLLARTAARALANEPPA